MIKLLKNKKANIIGDVFSGIGDAVKTTFDIVPRPIKFIMFLSFILLLGFLIQYTMQIFGLFCDSSNNPVNVGFNLGNIGMINDIPDANQVDLVGRPIGELPLSRLSNVLSRCSRLYPIGTDYKTKTNNYTTTDETWFYDGTLCSDCEVAWVFDSGWDKKCLGDVERTPDSEKSIFRRWFCGEQWNQACEPPENYYYDSSLNIYVCNDETCEGEAKTIGEYWNEVLASAGAKQLYPEGFNATRREYTNAVGISCKDLKPMLSIFGIAIFDYTLWIMITLIGILLWLYLNIKRS
ncbi:hypothetical protein CCP1ISM_260007 [Azospirillaceae bacterium]